MQTGMVLLPDGLKALKSMANMTGFVLTGAYFNKENPHNSKTIKRGRKRLFNEAIYALRTRVDRTFAWEDKFKRILLRFELFERIQQRYYGMKLLAYTLINLRNFCVA